jgi:hypothetical protein
MPRWLLECIESARPNVWQISARKPPQA